MPNSLGDGTELSCLLTHKLYSCPSDDNEEEEWDGGGGEEGGFLIYGWKRGCRTGSG